MSHRATVYQGIQIGAETVAGTAVGAGKRLRNLFVDPKAMTRVAMHRPKGSKSPTGSSVAKEHVQAKYEGALDYNDIAYILSSLLRKPTGTWTWDITEFGPDDPQTYTVQVGSSVQAEQFAFGVFDSFQLRSTETEVSVSGTMIGRKKEEDATLTATPTLVPVLPVNPKDVSYYVGDSVGGLAKITNGLEFQFGVTGRWKPSFMGDAAQDSFSDIVEGAPQCSVSLDQVYDSTVAGYMDDLRASTTKFFRMIAARDDLSFQLTFPFRFSENDPGDKNNVFGAQFKLEPIYDANFGSMLQIVVANSIGSL